MGLRAVGVQRADRGAGEPQPLAVLRVDVARHEDRVLGDAVGFHAAPDQVDA